ncbi:hypothetical protein NDU88_002083 [Pleurodeles waltl]|uniref:Uncharacterized protein n=1 Tax=Pleurodeles waltl TaxID=8319 RepID=A0AAV7M154_PLEWA|nr:hypothetical protein NDU88_002083 [Pleurodeles waltl]
MDAYGDHFANAHPKKTEANGDVSSDKAGPLEITCSGRRGHAPSTVITTVQRCNKYIAILFLIIKHNDAGTGSKEADLEKPHRAGCRPRIHSDESDAKATPDLELVPGGVHVHSSLYSTDWRCYASDE